MDALSLLQPWLSTIHDVQIRPVDVNDDSPRAAPPAIWLRFQFPENRSPPSLTCWLEAIELFVLLAWADPVQWMVIYKSKNNVWFTRESKRLFEEHSPQNVLGYELECTDQDDVRALCAYLTSPEDDFSREYHAVRAQLDAAGERGTRGEIPARLRLSLKARWPNVDKACWSSFIALANLRQDLVVGDSGSICRLSRVRSRIHEVHDTHWAVTAVTAQLLQDMQQVWASGIRVVDFPCVELSFDGNPSIYVNALHALLGVQREGCIRYVLLGHLVNVTVTPTFLSALAFSSSVCEVRFESLRYGVRHEQMHDFRRGLQWLAYALFRPNVSSTIVKISLGCGCLRMEHVDAIREVLEAEDPMVVLFPDFASSIKSYQHIRVSTKRITLHDPIAQGQDYDIVFKDMRVLNRTTDWWSVLLPGWGQAWVHQDHAVVTQVASMMREPLVNSKPRRIVLDLHDIRASNAEAIVVLLRLIGNMVKAIKFDSLGPNGDGLNPVNVLEACPTLEDLAMGHQEAELLPHWLEYFAEGLCTQLQRLEIRVGTATRRVVEDVEQLLVALGDNEHPIARQLDYFRFSAVTYIDDDTDDSSVLHTALRMLETNTFLRTLTLDFPPAERDKNQVDLLLSKFSKHHNCWLRTRVISLGKREKAAFLSALSDKNTGCLSRMKLDRPIVSIILGFAATRCYRRVHVEVRPIVF